MNSKKQQPLKSEKTLAEIFKYEVADGVSEYHLMIHAIQPESTYEEQLNAIIDTYYQLREKELQGTVAIFKRYFLSDASNQADTLLALTAESSDCALSIVEQPPLNGTKVAVWIYLQTKVHKCCIMVFSKSSMDPTVTFGVAALSIGQPTPNTKPGYY